ncbi:MAG: hypothetical protein ACKPBT_04665, partial [Microcystis aeruginosa]
ASPPTSQNPQPVSEEALPPAPPAEAKTEPESYAFSVISDQLSDVSFKFTMPPPQVSYRAAIGSKYLKAKINLT